MPPSEHIDAIARERIENLKSDMEYIECKLDEYSRGIREKMAGDVQMASKVNQIAELVNQLDKILIRGNGNFRSLKSIIETLQEEVKKLNLAVDTMEREKTLLKIAEMEKKSSTWKIVATLVASLVASIVAVVVAFVN